MCAAQVPFFVGSTAGTTVLGAFDPFEEIAGICKKHKVWMHVDGCWGAAALLTPDHRHLMKGCELSDSLAWNPHKLMGLPLQCSAFLTTHKGQHRKGPGQAAAAAVGLLDHVCMQKLHRAVGVSNDAAEDSVELPVSQWMLGQCLVSFSVVCLA